MKKISLMVFFLVPPAFSDTLSNPCENIELSRKSPSVQHIEKICQISS